MDTSAPIVYPVISERTLMMGIEAFERSTMSQGCLDRPIVRAAGILPRNSSTEIIDVNRLSQKSTSVIQYVEVANLDGRLYCVDGLVSTHCWLKIVTIAKDCQSCNVLLMTTDRGVILKTIRYITPGEPLLMWFTENILAMLNMPFLTPSNIQGQNRYICHMCSSQFEHPNPLKIHMALRCNRLDTNHLWTLLAREFSLSPKPSVSLSLFPQSTFKFQLTTSPQSSPERISPILGESMDSNVPHTSDNSSGSSDQASPTSSNQFSPSSSSVQVSPSSAGEASSTRKDSTHRQSAFKPYANQSNVYADVSTLTRDDSALTSYNVQAAAAAAATVSTDVHAAQMETIVSNLGKSKRGHLCIYCGKVYSRKYGLKIHIRTHTGYKPLKCKYCLRPFGDPSNLNKHVRLHADGVTPYRCELCGKVLVRRRDLERHVRSRHQENQDQASDTSSEGGDA